MSAAFDSIAGQAARNVADRVLHHAVSTGRPHRADDAMVVTRLGQRGLFVNVAVLLEAPVDWAATLDTVASIVPPGTTATLISPFDTPDLAPLGWYAVGQPPLMVREVDAGAAPPAPPELRIEEVADQPALEVFERTLIDGYPMPDLQPYTWGCFYDERVLGGPTRMWTGYVDGRPVATAAAHVAFGVNNVEMVATAEAARGHGYGGAVTWAATTADPTLPAVLIASDLGRPVYERLGYREFSRWTMWMRP